MSSIKDYLFIMFLAGLYIMLMYAGTLLTL